MALTRFVWYRPLDELGQRAIDLFACRLFQISEYDPRAFSDYSLAFYLTPDGRWIEYSADEDPVETREGWSMELTESYREVEPHEVAHSMILQNVYGGKLPVELEPYRKYGDSEVFSTWMWENGREGKSLPGSSLSSRLPSWDSTSRTLYCGGQVCRIYKKYAKNQFIILEAFESQGWIDVIKNPLKNEHLLYQTVKDINNKDFLKPIVYFRTSNCQVSWKKLASRRDLP